MTEKSTNKKDASTNKVEEDKEAKETSKTEKEQSKRTMCYLKSRANYTIGVSLNTTKTFIPPFGMIKVIKEEVQFDKNDAKNLTFVKI